MTNATTGIIIGGILPALLFGVSGVLQKASMQAGIGLGPYLLCIAVGVFGTGAVFYGLTSDRLISPASGAYALLIGVIWALSMGLVEVALNAYHAPLAKLAPLYNMNTLVVVLLALVVFAEWEEVSPLKLLIGTALIIIGGTLVADV